MTTISPSRPQPQARPRPEIQLDEMPALRRMWQASRLMGFMLYLYLVLLGFMLGAAVLDPRLVAGAPVWFKPIKFALASLFYGGTLLWMMSLVRRGRWLARLVCKVAGSMLLLEILWVGAQAARGVRSHFNLATPLDETLFAASGIAILFLWIAGAAGVVLLLLNRLEDPAFAWSLRLGLAASLVGGLVALPMLRLTPEQRAQRARGEMVVVEGGHSVGVPEGGPGLPFLGWSTTGGDLRVVHFVGLHGLQAIPLAGLLINRRGRRRLSAGRRTALVWIAGLGYIALTFLLQWQALRGQPLLAPDGLTLAAFAGLLLAAAAAAGLALRGGS